MHSFEETFGSAPAVRACAPGRVNLLGEHTDYNDGLVLPTALSQSTCVALGINGRDRFRVYSGELNKLGEFAPSSAPPTHFASYVYGCVQEFSQAAIPVAPLDVYIESTVPMGAGLSSSAALEVAMLRALRELTRAPVDDVELAFLAQRAEIGYAGVNCGILDQMAASLATEGTMLFLDTRSLERKFIPLPPRTEILVLHSGIERSLANTAYNIRREECREAAHLLGLESLRDATLDAALALPSPFRERARHVITENERVLRTKDGVDADELGTLMNASHASLRDDYAVSVPGVDMMVSLLQKQSTVCGAKMTGGGFGGACVALCKHGTAYATADRVLTRYQAQGHHGRLLVPPPPH